MDSAYYETNELLRARMPTLWTVALLEGMLLFMAGRLLPDDVGFGLIIIVIATVLLAGVLISPLLDRLVLVRNGADTLVRHLDWTKLRAGKLVRIGIALWGVPMACIFAGLILGGLLGDPPAGKIGAVFFVLLFNLILWTLGGVFFGLLMGGLSRLGARIAYKEMAAVARRPEQQRGLLFRVTWGAGLGAWISLPAYASTSSAIAGVFTGFLGAFLGMAALPAMSRKLGGHWRDRAALGWMASLKKGQNLVEHYTLRQRLALRVFGMGVPMASMLFGAMAPLFVSGIDDFGARAWAVYVGAFVLLALAFSRSP